MNNTIYKTLSSTSHTKEHSRKISPAQNSQRGCEIGRVAKYRVTRNFNTTSQRNSLIVPSFRKTENQLVSSEQQGPELKSSLAAQKVFVNPRVCHQYKVSSRLFRKLLALPSRVPLTQAESALLLARFERLHACALRLVDSKLSETALESLLSQEILRTLGQSPKLSQPVIQATRTLLESILNESEDKDLSYKLLVSKTHSSDQIRPKFTYSTCYRDQYLKEVMMKAIQTLRKNKSSEGSSSTNDQTKLNKQRTSNSNSSTERRNYETSKLKIFRSRSKSREAFALSTSKQFLKESKRTQKYDDEIQTDKLSGSSFACLGNKRSRELLVTTALNFQSLPKCKQMFDKDEEVVNIISDDLFECTEDAMRYTFKAGKFQSDKSNCQKEIVGRIARNSEIYVGCPGAIKRNDNDVEICQSGVFEPHENSDLLLTRKPSKVECAIERNAKHPLIESFARKEPGSLVQLGQTNEQNAMYEGEDTNEIKIIKAKFDKIVQNEIRIARQKTRLILSQSKLVPTDSSLSSSLDSLSDVSSGVNETDDEINEEETKWFLEVLMADTAHAQGTYSNESRPTYYYKPNSKHHDKKENTNSKKCGREYVKDARSLMSNLNISDNVGTRILGSFPSNVNSSKNDTANSVSYSRHTSEEEKYKNKDKQCMADARSTDPLLTSEVVTDDRTIMTGPTDEGEMHVLSETKDISGMTSVDSLYLDSEISISISISESESADEINQEATKDYRIDLEPETRKSQSYRDCCSNVKCVCKNSFTTVDRTISKPLVNVNEKERDMCASLSGRSSQSKSSLKFNKLLTETDTVHPKVDSPNNSLIDVESNTKNDSKVSKWWLADTSLASEILKEIKNAFSRFKNIYVDMFDEMKTPSESITEELTENKFLTNENIQDGLKLTVEELIHILKLSSFKIMEIPYHLENSISNTSPQNEDMVNILIDLQRCLNINYPMLSSECELQSHIKSNNCFPVLTNNISDIFIHLSETLNFAPPHLLSQPISFLNPPGSLMQVLTVLTNSIYFKDVFVTAKSLSKGIKAEMDSYYDPLSKFQPPFSKEFTCVSENKVDDQSFQRVNNSGISKPSYIMDQGSEDLTTNQGGVGPIETKRSASAMFDINRYNLKHVQGVDENLTKYEHFLGLSPPIMTLQNVSDMFVYLSAVLNDVPSTIKTKKLLSLKPPTSLLSALNILHSEDGLFNTEIGSFTIQDASDSFLTISKTLQDLPMEMKNSIVTDLDPPKPLLKAIALLTSLPYNSVLESKSHLMASNSDQSLPQVCKLSSETFYDANDYVQIH